MEIKDILILRLDISILNALRFFDSKYKVRVKHDSNPRPLGLHPDVLPTEIMSLALELSSTVDV